MRSGWSILLATTVCWGVAPATTRAATDCKSVVQWYAELNVADAGTIMVEVDTRGIAGNQYIDNVSFTAAFYGERNEVIGQGTFNFPDEQLGGLGQGFYVAALPHSYTNARSARGTEMEFLCKVKGTAFAAPRSRVAASAARPPRGPDTVPTVIGDASQKGGSSARATSASDFAGIWHNRDRHLRFIQTVRIVAIGPTELQIEGWLRCDPGPEPRARPQNCEYWGPDRAILTASGEVNWNHAAEPRVGRNILTLEGNTLKVFTPAQGWSNYFLRGR